MPNTENKISHKFCKKKIKFISRKELKMCWKYACQVLGEHNAGKAYLFYKEIKHTHKKIKLSNKIRDEYKNVHQANVIIKIYFHNAYIFLS